jgi:hypothetical protein
LVPACTGWTLYVISVAVIAAAFAGALIVQRRAISTARHSTWSCDRRGTTAIVGDDRISWVCSEKERHNDDSSS